KWLATNRHCPHCRANLTPENLVLCRFMDDLAKQVRDAMSATLRNASHPQTPSSNPADVCSTHNAPLFYFCHPCQTALCSDCAILTDTHKQHHIDHLQAVYSTHRDKLWSCLKSLFQSLKHLAETRSQVDTQLSALHAAKLKVHQKHQKQMQAAQDFLELQFTAKASILQKFDREVEHEVTRIQDTVQDMQTHLKVSSKMEVIQKSASILEIVEREHGANSKWGLQGSGASVPLVAKTFQSTLIPTYESSVMKIPDFMQRIRNTTSEADAVSPNGSLDVIYSEPFRASGVEWKLKVYCNGNKGTHLSVFVLMLDGYPAPSKYQYAIELVRKTQSSEPATAAHNEPDTSGVKSTREFISEFSPGECWGYTKFYPLELFPSSGFLSPEDGSLEIKFSVRAMDYAQRCRDLQWRLDKVEGGNNTVSTEGLSQEQSLTIPATVSPPKEKQLDQPQQLSSGVTPSETFPRPTSSPSHIASAAEATSRPPTRQHHEPRTNLSLPSSLHQHSRPRSTQSFHSTTFSPHVYNSRPHTADSSRSYRRQDNASVLDRLFTAPEPRYSPSNYEQNSTRPTRRAGSSTIPHGPPSRLPPIHGSLFSSPITRPPSTFTNTREQEAVEQHSPSTDSNSPPRRRAPPSDTSYEEAGEVEQTNDEFLETAIEEATRRIQGRLMSQQTSREVPNRYEQYVLSTRSGRNHGYRSSEDDDEEEDIRSGDWRSRYSRHGNQLDRLRQQIQNFGGAVPTPRPVASGIDSDFGGSDNEDAEDAGVRETLNRFIERLANVTSRLANVTSARGIESDEEDTSSLEDHRDSRGRRRRPEGLGSESDDFLSDEDDGEEEEDVDYDEMVDRIERGRRLDRLGVGVVDSE
ncbi:hypothetical protein HDU99_007414, partial [Rhizoclosmatium hyalinum]